MSSKMGAALLGAVVLSSAGVLASPVDPTYLVTYHDAVTGNNQFTNGGDHHWFINTGADDYNNDVYERPTAQSYKFVAAQAAVGNDPELVVGNTYSATDTNSPAYFGYLDIVTGRAGFDSQYLYFSIELFSDSKVASNGTATPDFGESSFYNIRFAHDPDGRSGILLSAQDPKELTGTYTAVKQFGYWDRDGSVGGPGGISVPNEGLGAEPGYEFVAIADGKAKDANADPEVLWARRTTSNDGRPLVEFAFDYLTFNALAFSPTDIPDIDPELISFIQFEATRGLKGQSNYLWNDQYSESQAGSPYDAIGLGNIYELDTLRGTHAPEPALLGAVGALVPILLLRRRRPA